MPANYVEYGPRASFPPPYLCEGGNFLVILLDGDATKIDDLVKKALNEPAKQNEPAAPPVQYAPFGHHIILMVGAFKKQSSQSRSFRNSGYASETGATFGIPLFANRNDGSAPYYCLFTPFVFVDNPMSLLSGREEIGYAKEMAQFIPSGGLGQSVTVMPFGGNFGPGVRATYSQLLQLVEGGVSAVPVAPPAPPAPAPLGPIAGGFGPMPTVEPLPDIVEPEDPEQVAKELMARAGVVEPDVMKPPGILDAVHALLAGEMRQVFLKQFPEAEAPAKPEEPIAACYQAIVEARMRFPNRVTSISGLWEVKINPLTSHPVVEELGVATEATKIAFRLETDLLIDEVRKVAP